MLICVCIRVYLRNCGHVDEISVPGVPEFALGPAREPGALDGQYGARLSTRDAKLLCHFSQDLWTTHTIHNQHPTHRKIENVVQKLQSSFFPIFSFYQKWLLG